MHLMSTTDLYCTSLAQFVSPKKMSKTDLTPEELDTVKVPRLLPTVITANASIDTTEEANVYVKELNMFVTVQLLEDKREVYYLGKFCEEHGYSYEWNEGQTRNNMKKRKIALCRCDNLGTIVVPRYRVTPTSLDQQMIQLKTPRSYHPMIRIQGGHREVGCTICQHGWRSLR